MGAGRIQGAVQAQTGTRCRIAGVHVGVGRDTVVYRVLVAGCTQEVVPGLGPLPCHTLPVHPTLPYTTLSCCTRRS